jgi:hypothetical protein
VACLVSPQQLDVCGGLVRRGARCDEVDESLRDDVRVTAECSRQPIYWNEDAAPKKNFLASYR